MPMMKKVKKAPMESPPSSSYPVGDEAKDKALLKHQSLMHDYEDLLKETEAKRKKMQMAIQKKHRLSSLVKFLRKKYKTLSKNPAQKTRCLLKKQPHMIPQPSLRSARPQNTVNQKDRNHRVKGSSISMTTTPEASAPRTTRLLDLNQVSTPSIEEMQELQMGWVVPVEVAEKLKVLSVEGELVSGGLKLSICREVGHNSNRVGKRKISWQDPVALRV